MADSDQDIFAEEDNVTPELSYGHLILFEWKKGLRTPFRMYMTHEFTEKEISDSMIINQLSDKLRRRKLKSLSVCPDKDMSLFSKIEISNVFFIMKRFFLFN